MNVEKYFAELVKKGHSFDKCKLHYCAEWDDLPVCSCSEEFECCSCVTNLGEPIEVKPEEVQLLQNLLENGISITKTVKLKVENDSD